MFQFVGVVIKPPVVLRHTRITTISLARCASIGTGVVEIVPEEVKAALSKTEAGIS
jgi:hypothetical protein